MSFNYCFIYSQLENTFVGEKHIHSYFLYVVLNILVYNAIHKYYFIVTFKKDKYFNYFRLMIALYFSYPLYHLEIVSYSKSGGLVFTFCQFIHHFMFIALKILCKFSRSRINFLFEQKEPNWAHIYFQKSIVLLDPIHIILICEGMSDL